MSSHSAPSPETSPVSTTPPASSAALLEAELAHHQARITEIARQLQEQANSKEQEVQSAIEEFMRRIGAADVAEAIKTLRNGRIVRGSKAKRLTPLTIKQLKYVLSRGATIAATAQYFKLCEATVNTRKKSFGLVGKKNMRPVAFAIAMKGMPMV